MKKIKYYLFTLLFFLVSIKTMNAFSINSSSSVYTGSTISITVNCTGSVGEVVVTSSNSSVLSPTASSQWCDNTSITFIAKANSQGVATLTFSAVLSDYGVYEDYDISRSTTINVVNRTTSGGNTGGTTNNGSVNINKIYSGNNNLSELSIDGYTLSPNFDKDTTEYTVELNPGTENIDVIAKASDSSAYIKGAGEISVSDGVNIIEVVVVAENGNEKKYKIVANLEEKNPIEVSIEGKKYRVIKKEKLLSDIDGYIRTNVKINNFDIPALYNEVTKVTLVGLKDKEGNISLFAYDSKTGEYKKYTELKFSSINLYIYEKKNSKYKKTNIKINDIDVPAYKLKGIEDYYLLYATNTTTGYEGYYLYDTKENSVQRYDAALLENITNEKDKYFTLVIVLSCVCFLSMLFLLIEVNRDSKRKNEE